MDTNLFYFEITIFLATLALFTSIWKPEAAYSFIIKRVAIFVGVILIISSTGWMLYLSSEDVFETMSKTKHLNFIIAQYLIIVAFVMTVFVSLISIFFNKDITSKTV